jgi:hypothetical protein
MTEGLFSVNEADFEDKDDWDVDNESNYTQTSVGK